jgi:hypothetical protein
VSALPLPKGVINRPPDGVAAFGADIDAVATPFGDELERASKHPRVVHPRPYLQLKALCTLSESHSNDGDSINRISGGESEQDALHGEGDGVALWSVGEHVQPNRHALRLIPGGAPWL